MFDVFSSERSLGRSVGSSGGSSLHQSRTSHRPPAPTADLAPPASLRFVGHLRRIAEDTPSAVLGRKPCRQYHLSRFATKAGEKSGIAPSPTGNDSRESPFLVLLIPLYNEESLLPALVAQLAQLRGRLAGRLSAILIDDCSTDGASARLSRYSTMPWIRIIHLAKRGGQHRALFRGMAEALRNPAATVIGSMDADMDPPANRFLLLLPYARNHDLVIGRRAGRKRYLPRLLVSVTLRFLSFLLRPNRFHDHGSMFRLYSRDLCKRCLQLEHHGAFLSGVSLLASRSPVEVTIPPDSIASPRPSHYSSGSIADAAWQMLKLLARHPFGMGMTRKSAESCPRRR